MNSKIYEEIKKFISENYKKILFLIVLFLIANFPLNYSILTTGGTINVNDRVSINNEYKSEGSFNLAYVTELKATPVTYILSYVLPNWESIPLEEYQASSNETVEDINKRAKAYLKLSEQSALKVAYERADKGIKVDNSKFMVVYINELVKEDIKIGDNILEIDNKKFSSLEDYKNLLSKKNVGDYIKLKLERGNKTLETKMEVKNIDGKKLTGISILELYEFNVNPKIEFSFKENENGSSGGLMLSLAIYDKLISEDLTKGLKIVGTGTIDYDGNVGEIDGVKYKLIGAVKSKADVFVAPTGNNYDECLKLIKEKKYDIKLIEAKTFDGVLEDLRKLNK